MTYLTTLTIFFIFKAKKKKKNNNKNIFHSHENSTKKFLNIHVYITYLKREKNGENSVKRKGKIKERLYLLCALFRFLPSRNHNLSVRNDGHVIISKKEKQKININQM